MKKIIFIFSLFIVGNSLGQSSCDSLFSLANRTYQEKGARQAIDVFSKIIDLNCNKLSAAYNNRGFMFNEIEDYKKAISDFNNALKVDSLNHEAYANEATSYNMLNDHLMANTSIEKAIRLSPNNYQYYRLKGDIQYSEEKFDSAIINYKKSISLKPEYLALYTLISHIYEKQNKIYWDKLNSNTTITPSGNNSSGQLLANIIYQNRDSAEAILTLLINRFPQNSLLIFNRAEFYRRNFLYDKAIPDYLQGLKNNRPDHELVCNLANCYDGKGDYKNAIKYYSQSIEIKPNVIAYANRGRKYKKMGNLAQAIVDEQNAIKLDPTYAQAYLIIGNCYLEMKQPKKASGYYKKGLAQNPDGEIKDLLEMQLANIEK